MDKISEFLMDAEKKQKSIDNDARIMKIDGKGYKPWLLRYHAQATVCGKNGIIVGADAGAYREISAGRSEK